MFKIEKDVPIPKTGSKYPFVHMGGGDSFVVRKEEPESLDSLSRKIHASAYQIIGKGKITLRREPGDESLRVWRVA